MSNSPAVVFDTSVLVSAVLIGGSVPDRAVRHALEHGSVVASPDPLDELAGVLSREKFDRYVDWTKRRAFLEALAERAIVLEPAEPVSACRDPDDDKFLELAVAAAADAIVTGDDDLLVLHPFRGTAILHPDTFLDSFLGFRQGQP
jgi:putative PIN family toxin of toxin-antitoxin system